MQPLRILIRTRPFFPSLGGLESVMQMLAEEFSRQGHQVTVVTETGREDLDSFSFQVLRKPSLIQLLRAQRSADVVIFGNISLRWWLELLLCPRPWIATHHGWYCEIDRPVRWRDRFKIWLTRLASANVSVSEAVNRFLGNPGIVIPNPYDRETFHLMPEVPRDRDLVFLGRLVSDKGADLLLEALALLKQEGLAPNLTLIGSGPEEDSLRKQATQLGLGEQTTFAGPKRGHELARLLNAHRIMVIPSRWNEPFGIVALEGIACGCVIVGSEGGGLSQAIGPCGSTFANGDTHALAGALRAQLSEVPAKQADLACSHLAQHQPGRVARAYLDVCSRVVAHPDIRQQVDR